MPRASEQPCPRRLSLSQSQRPPPPDSRCTAGIFPNLPLSLSRPGARIHCQTKETVSQHPRGSRVGLCAGARGRRRPSSTSDLGPRERRRGWAEAAPFSPQNLRRRPSQPRQDPVVLYLSVREALLPRPLLLRHHHGRTCGAPGQKDAGRLGDLVGPPRRRATGRAGAKARMLPAQAPWRRLSGKGPHSAPAPAWPQPGSPRPCV